jgi:N-acetyl-beta-hexosaminidase
VNINLSDEQKELKNIKRVYLLTGHTQAIGKAFPELLTPCFGEGPNKPYTPKYPDFSAAEMLNPLRNQTYAFMKELYREFKQVFKDDYIHLG